MDKILGIYQTLPSFVLSFYDLISDDFLGGDQGVANASLDGGLTDLQGRQLVKSVCENLEITENEFRGDLVGFLEIRFEIMAEEKKRLQRIIDHARALAGTLDDANFNRMNKYDTKLFNERSKLLKELESRQELRLAKDRSRQLAEPPVTVNPEQEEANETEIRKKRSPDSEECPVDGSNTGTKGSGRKKQKTEGHSSVETLRKKDLV